MPAKKGTKQESINKIISGGSVYVHSNYFVEGVEATKDKIVLRVGLSYYDGSVDKFLGRITAKVVDTEVQIDESQVGTKSLPTIKGARRMILDTLAYLNKTTTPTAVSPTVTDSDEDDEAEDVRADVPTPQGKKVIVIPITKVSSLLGKKVNGYTITRVNLYSDDGKWVLFFKLNDIKVALANELFECDYEIVEE